MYLDGARHFAELAAGEVVRELYRQAPGLVDGRKEGALGILRANVLDGGDGYCGLVHL
jgi:hypothetical protein